MIIKFQDLNENLKVLCNAGCGKTFKLKDALFTYDKNTLILHFYCDKCATEIDIVHNEYNEGDECDAWT